MEIDFPLCSDNKQTPFQLFNHFFFDVRIEKEKLYKLCYNNHNHSTINFKLFDKDIIPSILRYIYHSCVSERYELKGPFIITLCC